MAHRELAVALSMIVAASAASATQPEPMPPSVAPPGTAETKYCMKVEPLTGSIIERTRCWTREEWAEQGVDVDKEWAKEGVRVIG
ncbi:MAG TPA: hypothetical protein VEB39_06435 [Sphingomicrobium sp.]|nr:hypothetical protein [Sphingomicrobium sp.]